MFHCKHKQHTRQTCSCTKVRLMKTQEDVAGNVHADLKDFVAAEAPGMGLNGPMAAHLPQTAYRSMRRYPVEPHRPRVGAEHSGPWRPARESMRGPGGYASGRGGLGPGRHVGSDGGGMGRGGDGGGMGRGAPRVGGGYAPRPSYPRLDDRGRPM